ncbi:hypothetical protein CEK26_002646 [Fusarium fujikuroi]|nr:hypothetical protein CEK27_002642 [Fusarium fujikuroi]QGI87672.1 hypothetical protein CEK25_002628 [Fusarium fujikuroi]QGJ01202.1 hypothetical protein CEK26_002646 [Fusarium fujikuroi]
MPSSIDDIAALTPHGMACSFLTGIPQWMPSRFPRLPVHISFFTFKHYLPLHRRRCRRRHASKDASTRRLACPPGSLHAEGASSALLVPNLPTDVDFDFPSAPPCYNSKLVSLQQASLLCWRFHWLRLTFEISASPASPLPCRLCHPFEGAVSATFPFPPLEPTSFIECRHFRLSFEDTLLPC